MATTVPSTSAFGKLKDVLAAYLESVGREVPEQWDPSMNPFKDLGFKSRDGADLAEELEEAFECELEDDCNPLVSRDANGKKKARTLGEIEDFLKGQKKKSTHGTK